MLTVETLRKIRLAARDGKQSIRQITKDFNVSRNTVGKVLRSDQTHFEYHRDTVHRPKLGPFIDTLTTLLKHDQPLPLSRDVIINLLARQHEEASPEIVTIPAHLELNEPPVADCARYDRFRKEVVHVA